VESYNKSVSVLSLSMDLCVGERTVGVSGHSRECWSHVESSCRCDGTDCCSIAAYGVLRESECRRCCSPSAMLGKE
jgi:hypothetical protein